MELQFHITKMDLFLRNILFLLLSGLIKPFASIRNAPSGSIEVLLPPLPNGFALRFKFSLIFMNMQMR